MYQELEDYVRSITRFEGAYPALPVDPGYGDGLSERLIRVLIDRRAKALDCLTQTTALPNAEAIRYIQHREGNARCYGQECPYRREERYADCCGERSCLWKTYCEICRQGYRKLFVSYVHEDSTLARCLCGRLREAGVRVWFDEWDLGRDMEGEQIWEFLQEGLATTQIRREDAVFNWAMARSWRFWRGCLWTGARSPESPSASA